MTFNILPFYITSPDSNSNQPTLAGHGGCRGREAPTSHPTPHLREPWPPFPTAPARATLGAMLPTSG